MAQYDPFVADHIAPAVFLESQRCVVAYNISPIVPGHALVITKHSCLSVLELSDEEFMDFMKLARQATRLLCEAFGAKDFNWALQVGDSAGQTVPHLHMHLIPRHEGDLHHPGDWYPEVKSFENSVIDSESRPRLSAGEMGRIVSHLRTLSS